MVWCAVGATGVHLDAGLPQARRGCSSMSDADDAFGTNTNETPESTRTGANTEVLVPAESC